MVRSVATQKVGVTGHQVLPASARDLLVERLDEWFVSPASTVVVCSLAVGADTIVAEHLLRRGATLEVIVPCAGYDSTFSRPEAQSRYKSLLARAARVRTLPFPEPSEEAFMAAGRAVVDSADWLIAVWDGKPAVGLGGTADVVALARSLGRQVRVVWPSGASR